MTALVFSSSSLQKIFFKPLGAFFFPVSLYFLASLIFKNNVSHNLSGSSGFFMGMSFGKTFKIPSPALVKYELSSSRYNPFKNKPLFLLVCSTSLLKTLREKEKLLVTSNFSFSHSVFYPFGELSAIFIKFEIVVCKLFWERVK